MPRLRPQAFAVAAFRVVFVLAVLSAAETHAVERVPFPARGAGGRSAGVDTSSGTQGWWLGTAGVAVALAVCGALSLAARRFGTQANVGGPKVLGRTFLSPKHCVYLLQVGDRVLLVGTGPQAAPSLLGDVTEADPPIASPEPRPVPSARFGGMLDIRVGEEP